MRQTKLIMSNFGLYIHVPFCASRCVYCGFYSTTRSQLMRCYVDAVCAEMRLRSGYLKGTLRTVYLGGGTPSQLPAELLQLLFSNIEDVYGRPQGEVTIECNPDDVTEAYARQLALLPINRVSMGVQTFSSSRLRFLHRRHTAQEARHAVAILREAGIGNISIDLMFGFPGETMAEWESDINEALALNVEHISAYSLMYEEGTPLYKMLKDGRVSEIDEQLSNDMYDRLCDLLTEAGYEHYEISNFAKSGFRSQHNSSYWHQTPYIGLGAAAHSFDIRSRQWNVANVDDYIMSIGKGIVPMDREQLSDSTRYDDLITTALRTSEGIEVDAVAEPYRSYMLRMAAPYVSRGLLTLSAGRLALSRQGIKVSDMVMADMMYV